MLQASKYKHNSFAKLVALTSVETTGTEWRQGFVVWYANCSGITGIKVKEWQPIQGSEIRDP
jgi:hypothetical protein